MRLNKVFSIIVFLNLFALLLVFQRTEITKFSYKNKEQQDYFKELSDERSRLKDKLEYCKSLENINEQLLVQAGNFELPNESQIMLISSAAVVSGGAAVPISSFKERNFFSKVLFWLEHEAQAKSKE
ncbi:MAG: hypothetical protein KJ593_03750 [Candidatus Omnitrophica bacterium]|nr:hypothetical protein [Candidatus Omnitrophota bacterium]